MRQLGIIVGNVYTIMTTAMGLSVIFSVPKETHLAKTMNIKVKKMRNKMDKVIFRKWPDGDIIALFPQIAGNVSGYLCESYMHNGQYGAANPVCIVRATKPAKPTECIKLKKELRQIDYNPVVVKRFTYKDYLIRKAQYQQEKG